MGCLTDRLAILIVDRGQKQARSAPTPVVSCCVTVGLMSIRWPIGRIGHEMMPRSKNVLLKPAYSNGAKRVWEIPKVSIITILHSIRPTTPCMREYVTLGIEVNERTVDADTDNKGAKRTRSPASMHASAS
jgi:hypothetical protein